MDASQSPAWFIAATDAQPERHSCDVAGASIETLAWGKPGKPGLLFLHGNGGHADWWRFVAPFFEHDWRIGAISWSGMGRSSWRSHYSVELHQAELLAGAEAAGLFASDRKPVIVAHSFGSAIALQVAAGVSGNRFSRVIVVDNGARPPRNDPFESRKAWKNPGYDTLDDGVARFRLRPEQRCDNAYILEFIARQSLTNRDGRWHWCFDPEADQSRGAPFDSHSGAVIAAAKCPLDFIWGDRSALITEDVISATKSAAKAGSRYIVIPDAGHHLMLDQPLAFISVLRSLLAGVERDAG